MSQKISKYDIPIHQWEDRYYSTPELIRMGDEALAAKDYANACRYYTRAEASISGKRRLARLYINVPGILDMTQAERFMAAEALLLQAGAGSKDCSMDLAALYLDKLNRPVAALSCLLQAKYLGAEIHTGVIERCQRAIRKSDISEVEAIPEDCYHLASALLRCGFDEGRYIEYLLRVAVDAGENYSADAAILLGELFEEENNKPLAAEYYCIATALGNPPLLRKH